jgi:CRP/FNR family transcriptional regulator, cyclic AMP receptor protein
MLPVSEWMPIEELERLLAMVDAFEPLPRRELRRLASGASLERLGAGEKMAVDPREHARTVIVLLVGRAEVHDSGPREGRALTLSVAEAGTVVGVAGLSGRARGLRVGALLPSEFCLLEREAFEGTLRRNPEASLRLLGVLAERIGALEGRLAEMAHKGVRARLAGAILRLVEGEGEVTREGNRRLPTRYTHRQLASMIGANREAVTRAFGALRGRGAVRVKDCLIHVVDHEALVRATTGE